MSAQEKLPREDIERALRRALDRSEEESTWLGDFFDWLGEHLDLPEVSIPWGEVTVWLFVVALLAVLGWFLVQLFLGGRAVEEAAEPDAAARLRDRLRELRAEAAAARDGGDLRLALRLYLFALVLGLGRKGDLVYRDAWTNRELLARGRPSNEVRALLEPLVNELEAKEFGRDEVRPEDVHELEELVRRHLGAEGEAAA